MHFMRPVYSGLPGLVIEGALDYYGGGLKPSRPLCLNLPWKIRNAPFVERVSLSALRGLNGKREFTGGLSGPL